MEACRKSSLDFLKTKNATLDNYILSEDSLTVIDDKLKIASIPAVFVFGVDGNWLECSTSLLANRLPTKKTSRRS